MKYLLDANAVIVLLKFADSRVATRLTQEKPEDVSISSIVLSELFYGAYKSQSVEKSISRIDRLQLEVIAFDREDARHAGQIRASLALQGKSIGPNDVLIAGQAKSRGLIVVTNNTREFGRVEGLAVEDWSR